MTNVPLPVSATMPDTTGSRPSAGGSLFIIGGGDRPDYLMRRIVELGGGDRSRMVVIPAASDFPRVVAWEQKEQLEAVGAGRVDIVDCTRDTADHPAYLEALEDAQGVFFSGGDQSKLASTLHGTRLLEAVRRLHQRGGVVAGTSAGAAVMSRLMITGDPLPGAWAGRGAAGTDGVRRGRVPTGEGFGFVDHVIVDQHFLKRNRQYRLHSLVSEHPHLLGVGIDEATALIVHGDETCEVTGESCVLIYDLSPHAEYHVAGEPHDVHVHRQVGAPAHILHAGDRYCLRRRRRL